MGSGSAAPAADGRAARRRAAEWKEKARAAVAPGGSSHANLLDLVKRFQKQGAAAPSDKSSAA